VELKYLIETTATLLKVKRGGWFGDYNGSRDAFGGCVKRDRPGLCLKKDSRLDLEAGTLLKGLST
jgi:hypothetical protein